MLLNQSNSGAADPSYSSNSTTSPALHGFIGSVRFPWHPWMIMGLGNIASFSVGWLASLILPDGRSASANS